MYLNKDNIWNYNILYLTYYHDHVPKKAHMPTILVRALQ